MMSDDLFVLAWKKEAKKLQQNHCLFFRSIYFSSGLGSNGTANRLRLPPVFGAYKYGKMINSCYN